MFRIRQPLFHKFLFAYLSFLPDTDIIMRLLQFVHCITNSFQLWR